MSNLFDGSKGKFLKLSHNSKHEKLFKEIKYVDSCKVFLNTFNVPFILNNVLGILGKPKNLAKSDDNKFRKQQTMNKSSRQTTWSHFMLKQRIYYSVH
ncbi:CLUMA_CG002414, isoform A [Clunio marinus]|uniref:CLUMA_CG002414, isoform A n=1 Tax=Clunio marinus TaxID=568069 RepID=A0A1J1HL38_9DIPT|nr:CLUMA_CG002414, isoform A [Clunio marinus]